MEIIISTNVNKPIYEQITSQIKSMVMNGELKSGENIPSMRALAKTLQISVITVQKAYEDLQKDGFIETIVGKGSFITSQGKEFFKEEQQKLVEQHLQNAVEAGKKANILLPQLIQLLTLFYEEEN